MDYGKIAYYKTQELERQAGLKQAVKYDSLTLHLGRVPGERLELAELLGSGLIIARVQSGGSVSLYADAALIAKGDGGFTASVPADSCRLYISSAAVVESVQITAAGAGVSLSSVSPKLRMDSDGSFDAALDTVDGVLTLYTPGRNGFDAALTFGPGGDYDIAVYGGIYVAFNLPDGHTNIVKFSESLSVEHSCLLSLSAKYIGIAAYNGGIALAYYAAGAVSVMLLDGALCAYDNVKAHVSPSVTDVGFVKGGGELTLVINDGGDCLIRTAE